MTDEQVMNITVVQKDFHGEKVRFVNARDLHKRLGVGRRFATRITERIKDYKFELETDYFTVPQIGSSANTSPDDKKVDFPDLGNQKPQSGTGGTGKGRGGDRKTVEYIMTIDMAKELCMVENNDDLYHLQKKN